MYWKSARMAHRKHSTNRNEVARGAIILRSTEIVLITPPSLLLLFFPPTSSFPFDFKISSASISNFARIPD
ncbi:hypothetical protein vseg_001936 [Gypsophila vaccaria]